MGVEVGRKVPWIMLFLGIICISVSAIFVKEAGVDGISSAFYRMFFAILIILPFYVRAKNKDMSYKGIGVCLLGGMFFAFELVFWNIAILISNATFPTLLVNLSSVWVGIGAMFLFKEKLNQFHWMGNGVAIFGIAVLIGIGNIVEMKVDKGFIFSIIASIFLAIYVLAVKQVRLKNSTLEVVFFTFLGSVITLFLCCVMTESKLSGFSVVSWTYLVCLGLITQVGGYFFINFSLGYIDSSKVSVCTLVQPILTAIFAGVILHESFAMHHIVGGAIVLAGLLMAIAVNAAHLRNLVRQRVS